MVKPIKSLPRKKIPALEPDLVPDRPKVMTAQEVADEIDAIRASLQEIYSRLNRLSWSLMSYGIQPGGVGDDIPF